MPTQPLDANVGVSDTVSTTVQQLSDMLVSINGIELAILIGSRATGTAGPESDWDIAIQWKRGMDFMQQLAATEQLRRAVAKMLGISEQEVDLIDLPTARLAMRAVVAEDGIALKGEDSLAWHHFLQRTWRELEEQYWEKTYAA
ncbi:MAG: nucleotidyltransferase domain-containing protein [Desulfuromonadaceae bacterium]|nr:nucleotidyltransferase domain-containing protein [Desulfuromonadaceae bacterium]MDD2848548.1 nucleotidyltransferase domain-containing protein [Desulfuromonadaceae bacterium]MDD4131550.1 nucleotidyltransferase domain-containing protein [Desulfuromonadaceae bacterium]